MKKTDMEQMMKMMEMMQMMQMMMDENPLSKSKKSSTSNYKCGDFTIHPIVKEASVTDTVTGKACKGFILTLDANEYFKVSSIKWRAFYSELEKAVKDVTYRKYVSKKGRESIYFTTRKTADAVQKKLAGKTIPANEMQKILDAKMEAWSK